MGPIKKKREKPLFFFFFFLFFFDNGEKLTWVSIKHYQLLSYKISNRTNIGKIYII